MIWKPTTDARAATTTPTRAIVVFKVKNNFLARDYFK